MKILLRILAILLVIGLVGGGIYLLIEKGNLNLFGTGQNASGMPEGSAPAEGGGERPEFSGENPTQGQPGGDFERAEGGPDGGNGFSALGLVELGLQFIKVAVITVAVVLIQWLVKLFKRDRHEESTSAT